MIAVRPIPSELTISIRQTVLCPGLPLESCRWDKDEDADTFHLGGWFDGEHAGVCTFLREPFPGENEPAYRLRGMAVLPESRGEGVGELMLASGEERAGRSGVSSVWCDAREGAVRFYQKYGWKVMGGLFEIPGVGPCLRMRKELAKRSGCS